MLLSVVEKLFATKFNDFYAKIRNPKKKEDWNTSGKTAATQGIGIGRCYLELKRYTAICLTSRYEASIRHFLLCSSLSRRRLFSCSMRNASLNGRIVKIQLNLNGYTVEISTRLSEWHADGQIETLRENEILGVHYVNLCAMLMRSGVRHIAIFRSGFSGLYLASEFV